MFKGFIITIGVCICLGFVYVICDNLIKYFKTKNFKIFKLSKKKTLTKVESFEEKLANQYQEACFSLLKKQALASKTKDELLNTIKELKNSAKQCKIAFEKTNNPEFQKNSILFLTEKENAESLLSLANNTIDSCAQKLETANIEYKAIISKVKNKRLEYGLLEAANNSNHNMLLNDFDYNNILDEYKNKIDIKRLDLKVEETLNQKVLVSSNLDFNIIPDNLKIAYNEL